jgi:hypothetical protein
LASEFFVGPGGFSSISAALLEANDFDIFVMGYERSELAFCT